MAIEFDCVNMLDLPAKFARLFKAVITDPPYASFVHENTISAASSPGKLLQPGQQGGVTARDLGFDALDDEERQHLLLLCSQAERWSVIYSDVESSHLLAGPYHPFPGLEYIRTMPWIRWSQPQMTGTMPPQEFEHIVILHSEIVGPRGGRKPKAKHWNGPGSKTAFDERAMRGKDKHPAQKTLDQCLSLVSWYSDPGDSVADWFCGDGTIALACKLLDRECYSCDEDPTCLAISQQRQAFNVERDRAQAQRWLDTDHEPESQQQTGPSVERAWMRYEDKERVQSWL